MILNSLKITFKSSVVRNTIYKCIIIFFLSFIFTVEILLYFSKQKNEDASLIENSSKNQTPFIKKYIHIRNNILSFFYKKIPIIADQTKETKDKILIKYYEINATHEDDNNKRVRKKTINKKNKTEHKTNKQKEEWRKELVSGIIKDTFSMSAKKFGLTLDEIQKITTIFQGKIDFSRSIYKNDKFQVIRGINYSNYQRTGKTRIESIRIQQKNHAYTAFLFKDNCYYDENGKKLSSTFMRIPLGKTYQITSHFNEKRTHPITGIVGPHNGVDFATPKGTKVLSIGDGVVTSVGNHPLSGKYIEIQHERNYKTRYLHLHNILVSESEVINQGQIIALSGNSGLSTGSHLHFELHINGHPVDPMKVNISTKKSIAKKDKRDFYKKVLEQTRILDTPSTLAKNSK